MNKVLIGEGLKPQGPNLCVLNVMRTLLEDKDSIVYIPQDYILGSLRQKFDPKVHQNLSEAGKPVTVLSIQSNAERFNFSLTGTVDVMVEEEEVSGYVHLCPKKIFRSFNIVRDGNLMVNYLICKLSKKSFDLMMGAGILYYSNDAKVPAFHLHNLDLLYKIVLDQIPVVSLNWAQPHRIGLYKYLLEEVELTDLSKRLNSLVKRYKAEGQTSQKLGDSSEIYQEKVNHEYDNSMVSTTSVSVPCVVYRLKGAKCKAEMTDEDLEAIYRNLSEAEDALKSVKSRLRDIRFVYRCIIFAIEKSEKKGSYDWSEPYELPRSTKIAQQAEVEYEGQTLILERITFTRTEEVPVKK